ncbi:KRAB [Mytilus coruscus]|uniref:KRAB n=1 Tax=Mytilus coruscus TaxID=42192 RepID=A0A6J8DW92_MYTCO|nr:KRAB [Mytilus coruscus]
MTDPSDGQPMYILQEGGEEDNSTLESQQGTVNIFTQDGQMVMEITGQGDNSQFAEYGIDEVQAGEQMLQIANTFINAQEGEPHLLHIANTFTDQGKNINEKKTDENYDTHIKGEIIQSENGNGEMHIVFDENEHIYSVQGQENSSSSSGEQSVLVQIPEIQNITDQSFINSGVQTVENISQVNDDNQEIIIEGMPIQYQNLQNVRSEVLPDGTVQLYVVDNEEGTTLKEEEQTTESEKFVVTEEEQPAVVSVVKETRYRDVATQITCYPKFSRQGLYDVATQVTKRDILGGTVKNRQLPNGTTIIQNNIKTQNQSTVILNAGASSQMVFYKCNICGKLYKNKPNWQNHIKSHATEKVYMCGHCGKIFQKASLASHLRTHSELAQIAVFENLPDNMKRKNHKAIPGLILSSEEASIIELDIIDVPTEADESMLPEPEPEPEPPQADLSEVYTDNDIPAKMHMEVEAETEIQEGTKSKFVYKCNDRGTVERTPVKMEPSEELQIIENEMSRDQSQINRVDTTREIITTDSGTEMEIEQLAIQQDISLDEEIHIQEETCVTIDLGIEKFKADSFPIANAHRIPAKAPVVGTKRPDAIIVRFMHYADKQCIMTQAYKVANKKIRIVDDLPVIMKEARNDLAKIAYNIRTKEKLQTRIRARGVHLVLETRLNARDVWNVRKDISCV